HTDNQPLIKLIPQLYSENVYPHLNDQRYSKDSSCPSSLGSGIDPGAIESKIINSETIITNKNSELNSLVDGGDTEELNTDVQISIPPDAMQVRQQLMNESPYLSDTVMKSAIDKENVLPNAMIRDVLVANPQSAKSDNVIETLDERLVPMPDYMMAQIMQGKNTTSAKENLEAEIQNWKGKNEKAYSNMFRYYKNDTTLNSFDSVVYWLQNQNTIDARYRLAFEYLSNNDTSLINSVLSGITNDFVLNSKQNLIHQDYLSYFQIINALVSQGKTIMEADSTQIVSLQLIANNDKYLPGIYARNILIALGEINYQEAYILPNPLKATDVDYYPLQELENLKYLKIFPNPARDYIVVEYNTDVENYLTDNGQQNIILRFTDINGKLIRVKHLNRAKDQLVINTKSFNTGVYICNLFVDGKLIDTSKFTIY
ncbi:MAG: T9SS type A sorting domain-containing protein, partial [Saprospiraceae bacterium]|nr:T9SS type A sorting domain-containing protein [Saprospiraceae bacterium]